MKLVELKKELRALGATELKAKLNDYRKELFNLRMNIAVSHVKNYSQLNKVKKNIARTLTLISQKIAH